MWYLSIFGQSLDVFKEEAKFGRYPGTIECVTRVKEFAYHNWQMYNGPKGSSTPGNLLAYPINVMADGTLENLSDVSHFPDFPGDCRVMGKKSAMLPQKLTT